MPNRRKFLQSAGATLAVLTGLASLPARASGLRLGAGSPFSYARLREHAKTLAAAPYRPPPVQDRGVLEQIDYDAHGKLRFDPDYALFAQGPGRFPLTFFHLGRYFQTPVRVHVVDASGAARAILYDSQYFDMPADSPARRLGPEIGFAGFRLQESRFGDQRRLDWRKNDWAAFLGASYFRAIGDDYQYGISARGIAVDVALAHKSEEFPAFTDFFVETPAGDADTVVVHALLDGPSICGAFSFHMSRDKGVVMEIQTALFLRRDIERLGIAPATSMYWYSETARPAGEDWRPEVHDSDGLAIWNGSGERIWRPLNNPPRTVASTFGDRNPRGYGLMQRDRSFDHYLDGVHYERRPGLWVEPLDDWGEGSVELIEIPTSDETHDNIVAMWVPAAPAKAGSSFDFRYRLYWQAAEPGLSQLARCVATRLGRGGEPGQVQISDATKFVVEFFGGELASLPYGVLPQAVIWSSRGEAAPGIAEPVPDGVNGHWRVRFDLRATGSDPVELRLYLRHHGHALTETWLYQFHPVHA